MPEGVPGGPLVLRVISYRKSLADPDGLAPKTWIDQFAKLLGLPDDSLKHIRRVEFEQVKVRREEEEKTVIEAWAPM